jgi:hypothetical protein
MPQQLTPSRDTFRVRCIVEGNSCHAAEQRDLLRRTPGNSRARAQLSDFNRGLRRSGGRRDNLDVPAEQFPGNLRRPNS